MHPLSTGLYLASRLIHPIFRPMSNVSAYACNRDKKFYVHGLLEALPNLTCNKMHAIVQYAKAYHKVR